MADCWNGYCIASAHDDNDHVDVTGFSWTQAPEEIYCPRCARFHAPNVYEFFAIDADGRQVFSERRECLSCELKLAIYNIEERLTADNIKFASVNYAPVKHTVTVRKWLSDIADDMESGD